MSKSSSRPDTSRRRLSWLVLIASGALPFLIVPNAADMVVFPRLAFLGFVVVLGIGLSWREFAGYGKMFPRTVAGPWLVFVGWGAISAVTAHNPFLAAHETVKLLVWSGWTVLLAGAVYGSPESGIRFTDRLLRVLVMVGLVQGLVGLLQYGAGLLLEIPPGTYPPYGFMASSNYFGEIMLLLTVVAAGNALLQQGLWRWVSLLSTLVGLAGAISARARAVQVALGAVLVLLLFCIWAVRRDRDGKGLLGKVVVRWALFGAVMGGLGLGAYLMRQDSFRLMELAELRVANDSARERIVLWNETIKMTAEHPFLGVGPQNWKFHIVERGLVSSFQGFATRFFMRAHNDFLQAFAERGVIGGLGFLAFFVLVFVAGVRKLERSENRRDQILRSMALCGLFAFAVMACFNFPSERPASVMLLSLFVVLAAGKRTTEGAASGKTKSASAVGKGLAAMLGIVSLAFALLNIQIVRSDIQALNISFAKQAQNWYAVHEAAKKADRWYYPIHSMNGTPIPWYQGTALLLRGESARALPFLQRAYDIHPWHPHVVSNYGSVLFGTGKQEETVKMWEDLLAIFPEFHEVRVNLNEIYFMRSRWDKVEENLTFWENSAKPRDISLYLTQVKTRMDSVRIRFNQ